MRIGQPALLYLVPTTLGTTLLLGFLRGELNALWNGVPRAAQDARETHLQASSEPDGTTMEVGNVVDDRP